jgi:hypothetical protein
MFSYFKNLLDNYNNVCATALFRNDFYYKSFVEGKQNKSNNKQYNENNSGSNKQSKPSNSNANQSNDFANDFDSGFSDDSSTVNFDDDVPF